MLKPQFNEVAGGKCYFAGYLKFFEYILYNCTVMERNTFGEFNNRGDHVSEGGLKGNTSSCQIKQIKKKDWSTATITNCFQSGNIIKSTGNYVSCWRVRSFQLQF